MQAASELNRVDIGILVVRVYRVYERKYGLEGKVAGLLCVVVARHHKQYTIPHELENFTPHAIYGTVYQLKEGTDECNDVVGR